MAPDPYPAKTRTLSRGSGMGPGFPEGRRVEQTRQGYPRVETNMGAYASISSLSSTLGVPSGGQQIWYLDVEPNSHPGHGVNTSFYEKTASLDCGWCSSSGYHQETIKFTIPTLGPILESAFIEREKNLEPISIRSSGFELELNPGKPAKSKVKGLRQPGIVETALTLDVANNPAETVQKCCVEDGESVVPRCNPPAQFIKAGWDTLFRLIYELETDHYFG
ncbi:hypothetical protein BKA70DRAFT_1229285 [Coprinopsis sp. MPI-PUGE-AT-0042]|nr:hypothetical protein BKA70DRAFT_1229285 [Coprinopsis sp. MPI-PUGE-AT-0042]